MICRICKCDDMNACDLGDLGPCWWVAHELCARCALKVLGDRETFLLVEQTLVHSYRRTAEVRDELVRLQAQPEPIEHREKWLRELLRLFRRLRRDELVRGLTMPYDRARPDALAAIRKREQKQKPEPSARAPARRARARARKR